MSSKEKHLAHGFDLWRDRYGNYHYRECECSKCVKKRKQETSE